MMMIEDDRRKLKVDGGIVDDLMASDSKAIKWFKFEWGLAGLLGGLMLLCYTLQSFLSAYALHFCFVFGIRKSE